jgi:hypothetical protein
MSNRGDGTRSPKGASAGLEGPISGSPSPTGIWTVLDFDRASGRHLRSGPPRTEVHGDGLGKGWPALA